MRTKELYGVYKNPSGFQARFYDIVKQEPIYLGQFTDEKEAKKVFCDYQFEFYKERKFILPKGVGLDFVNRKFSYSVFFNNKIILSKRFDTVQLCIKFRDELLKTIIG